MPEACLVSRPAGELELNRVTFTTSLALWCVRVIAWHRQTVDRIPLVNLDVTCGVLGIIDQGKDRDAIRRILPFERDGAMKDRGWRWNGESWPGRQRGGQARNQQWGEDSLGLAQR
jgi:hypothetical protein